MIPVDWGAVLFFKNIFKKRAGFILTEEMSMIKQNHLTVTALFVVVLGVGLPELASAKQHKKTHDVIQHHGAVTKNIKVKDKHSRLSSKNTCKSDKHVRYRAVGTASWYGYESGNKTACGARFNPLTLTAAHKKLPFGTKVRVTNMDNKKSVVVTINDRGPYVRGRIIDLSLASARRIDMKGTTKVKLETL